MKKYRLSIVLLLLSMVCYVAFQITGSYIDETGILVEPFALIPLFWLLLLFAFVTFAFQYLKGRRKR
ncbi:hypothetical protein C942_00211 [Photobacterium marinum]|uniref:DUF3955 domain-containing protein n=1 Tax=Photobacterium marinum TaxID=1056511 RepID=L8JI43_9GAMM|nr:DUF3955 domain-containing protein [Photobacterium marinum]ELR67903.1 hypothetical protein C942_00211 [Photobacterium marinum]